MASSPPSDELKAAPPPPPPQPQEAAAQHPSQEPQPEQQRRAILAPLPLDWTRLNECNDDSGNPSNNSSVIRYPWDVADIDITDTNLTLVGTAGQKITRMGSDLHEHVSPNLTHLVLRSHLIRTMEGIRALEHLELLELYDNMIDELSELDVVHRGHEHEIAAASAAAVAGVAGANVQEDGNSAMSSTSKEKIDPVLTRTKLRVLDISYNVIRDMGPIALCPNLQELCK